MSTVKATYFQHASASTPNLTLASDGSVSGGLPSPNRNLLYNGAMQVAQRGTSTAGISSGDTYYTADRWRTAVSGIGTWTQSVENDAPTGSGLRKSLKMLCTTAKASPSAADYCNVQQLLEGQDVQRIAKGTASAQQLTLSFWVKANVTGTYTFFLYDSDNARMVGATYTVSASATWEKKSITFPADTSGVLNNDNDASLILFWNLAAGSNRTSGSVASSWQAYATSSEAPGQTNLAAATNNYWQITGVQLEVGPVPTAFEFKSYGQELRECQRYYWRNTAGSAFGSFALGFATTTTGTTFIIQNPVPMRVTPTADHANLNISDYIALSAAVTTASIVASESTPMVVRLEANTSGLTQYRPYGLRANNNAAAYLGMTAEL